MVHARRWTLAIATILLAFSAQVAHAADADEMVENPYYKYWSKHKPGSTVTMLEKTVLSGPDKNLYPDGIDEKEITYTLRSVTPEKVVVEVQVSERSFLNTIEDAATKHSFPAKVTKANLRAGLHGVDPKRGQATLEVLGKKLDCVTLSGTEKKDNQTADHEVWLSEKVPGGIVKHVRTTKQDGKVIADTTIIVKAYKSLE